MKHLTHVASRFVNCPLMIHPPKLEVIIKAIGPRLGIAPEAVLGMRVPLDATTTLMSRYTDESEDREYAVIDRIAVIPVQGTLLKKETFMSAWSGASSYERIQSQVAAAIDDSGVRGILLDIDSPGGETGGCFDLADYIYAIRGVKPIYAVANDIALSAAYAIASSASRIFLNRTSAVGSIGVYALHMDQSGFDEAIGAKYTYVFAGQRKVDGNPHQPLSDRALADIQDEVDREYGIFTETVARNRKTSVDEIVATQAAVVWAENALPLLADQIGTFDDAMNALRGALGAPVETSTAARAARGMKGESAMSKIDDALAKKDGETEEKKSRKAGEDLVGKPPCDEESKSKKSDKDEEDENDDETEKEEMKREEKQDGKKKALGVFRSGESLEAMRSASEIQAISALCKMAGMPEKAADFLTMKDTKGQFVSVADVSEALTNARVAESEKRMISNHVNPNAGSGGVQELEAQAVSLARQNRGQLTPGMYVFGASSRLTKERAYAQMLEEHPEAYEQFRARHNAKALIGTLEAAGIRLAR